jgi:molybdopterin synthase sulfur carrier subunit
MGINIRIPVPLRKFTQNQGTVEAEGKDIAEVLQDLDSRYPGIRERLYEGEEIRRFINVYINEEDIRFLKGEKTAVKDGDRISIIPAISGGN